MSFSQPIPGHEHDPSLQASPSRLEEVPGYVKNKIKSQNPPNRGSRARKEWRGSLAKVIKKAESIAELLTEDDQEENLRVIREAKLATHRLYDFELKKGVDVPDHKTRLAATMLDLASREGKPVERQLVASAQFEDLASLQKRLEQSPAYCALISEQKTVQGKEITPGFAGASGRRTLNEAVAHAMRLAGPAQKSSGPVSSLCLCFLTFRPKCYEPRKTDLGSASSIG
jgi:hypothetical protein